MKKSDEQNNGSDDEINEVNIPRNKNRVIDLNDPDYYPSDDDYVDESSKRVIDLDKNPDYYPSDDDYVDEPIKRVIDLNKDPDYYPSDDDIFEESILDSSLMCNRTTTSPVRSEEIKNETPYYYESSDDEDEHDEGFEESYICNPLSAINKEHLEDGNRIIMPQSALECLTELDIDYPMMFEIKKQGSDHPVSHCGVLEFSGEEGFVFLPDWMIKNLDLSEGEHVMMKSASLKQGTFMKIQPHQTAFINLPDAKDVLEKGLRGYSCVTTGDTICIPHNQARFLIDIVETKPERAICVVETDCEVDFAPPLDYKEPKKKLTGKDLEKKQKQEEEKAEFQPFPGRARRLDGVSVVGCASSLPVDNMTTRAPERENLATKSDVCNCEPSKSSSSSGKTGRENSETEEKTFKPFTGKKYTLNG